MKADRRSETGTPPSITPPRESAPAGASTPGPPVAPFATRTSTPSFLGSQGHRWGLALLAVTTFTHFSALPLAHTDLWGHLAYGRFISQHGLPATEPLQRPGAGIPFIDTAWLAQWVAFQLSARLGWAALQWGHALVLALGALLLGTTALRLTAWRPALWLAPAGWLLLAWSPWQVIRPQLLGVLLFLVLLWLLSNPPRGRSRPVLVGGLFALWANLHGSFPIGLLALLTIGLERYFRSPAAVSPVAKAAANTKTTASANSDQALVTANRAKLSPVALDLAAAVAGTLVNPWGVRLWPAVLSVAQHPNVADLTEWQPLRWDRPQGAWLAGALALLITLAAWRWFRHSGRMATTATPPAEECTRSAAASSPASPELHAASSEQLHLLPAPLWPLLLTLLFTTATCLSARYLVWTAATLPLALVLMTRFRYSPVAGSPWPELRPAVCCLLLALVSLSAPITRIWNGQPRAGTGEVVADTPLDEVAALQQFAHVCQGPVLAPLTWGDYLLWAAPPQLPPFTASHVHWLPRADWLDQLGMMRGDEAGWQTLHARGFTTALLPRQAQRRLIDRLEQDPQWRLAWSNPDSVLFVKDARPARE